MLLLFVDGLGVWLSGDGMSGLDIYDGVVNVVFVFVDVDFVGCFEM